jgi:hypothetical protein
LNYAKLTALAFIASGALLVLGDQPPENLQARLDSEVDEYDLSARDLARALIAVAQHFEIPMGIEWIQPASPKPVNLRWKKTTVRAVLESVVRAHPGYRLGVGQGSVHVFYAGADTDPSNFLNIPIPALDMDNVYPAVARWRLEQIVRAKVSPPPQPGRPSSVGYEITVGPRETKQSFHWKNSKVRDVLYTLALDGDYKIWTVTFPESSARTSTGFRPTLSLWITQAGPNELPDWDRFDWRHQPPAPPLASKAALSESAAGRK